MATQQFVLLVRREFAIIGNSLVMAPRDEVEEVLLEIGASTGNCMDFVLANHFRERNAELGGTHSASQGDHHFPASIEMGGVGVGGVFEHCRIEVTVMPINKLADATHLLRHRIFQSALRKSDAKVIPPSSSVKQSF